MTFRCGLVQVAIVGLGVATPSCLGAIRAINSFSESPVETFDQYQLTNAIPSLSVLKGRGTVFNRTSGGSIKLEWSSSLGGDLVTPLSGMMMGQLGIADWQFNQPVRRFGAFIANNSGKDDGTAFFYDAADNLIGSMSVSSKAHTHTWTWNGWESDTPFARMRVVGNGLINGFLWYENVRVSDVPAGATAPMLLIGMIAMRRRR